jgi:AcrR family transcriptional regulator
MTALRTARDRARAAVVADILDAARRRVAADGAAGLSLRAVARELGMVSSAIYRYFPSRDDLLTALIIEAYDDLGACAEQSAAASIAQPPADRRRDACRAIRKWALAHPHEYALLYGSPVPGYRAPELTVSHAARVAFALAGIARDASARGELHDVGPDALPPAVDADAARVSAALGLDAPHAVAARMLVAWTQVFGMLSFELFGHLVGSVDDNAAFFDHATAAMGRFVGFGG